jgi:ATP-binding cassette subfamily B protein
VTTPIDAHAEEVLGKVYDARLMARLVAYLGPHRWMTAGAVALILLSSLLRLVGPLTLAVALDLYIAPEASPRPSAPALWLQRTLPADLGPAEGLLIVGGIFLTALVLTSLVLYVQGCLMEIMGQYVMFDLRQQVFRRMQFLPVSYFDRNPLGRLVTRVTTDIASLNELFTSGLVSVFGDVMLLVGIVGVLFWLDWRLALVAFSILPLLLWLTFWFKLRARQSYRQVRVRVARINAFLQEHLTGMSLVQLFNREGPAYAKFQAINDQHRRVNVDAIFYYAVYFPLVEIITALGVGLLIWYGGGEVLQGALSLGALIAFLQYARQFYEPLADLSQKYNILQSAMASSERIFGVLDTPLEITSPEAPERPAAVQGRVEFAGVDFAYLAGEPVLHGVSFVANPGETVAVVGHTGAGKSTLANLLLRFYDVDGGAVRLDGIDVRRWNLQELRSHVGLVLQDVFLFAGSVAENIRLGRPDLDLERLRWAAREVHALDFIERLPGGFDALVRERGAGLSTGQKQLIAFARALAFDPKILILDEATSSIDTETEQRIQAALERLLVNRTSIVIAHRLSTIQRADRILVMHKGRICEQGTHQELLALGGIYQKLYLLQYKDQEVAVA